MRQFRCAAVFALSAVGVACGGDTTASPTCAVRITQAPPQIHATAGHLSADADRGTVAPGATVTFIVTATGPAQYQTDCGQPLQVSIADAAGLAVAIPEPTAMPGRCGTVTLRAGESAVYSTSWTPDATLPNGVYSVTLIVGDQSALTLAVPVHTAAGATPICG